MQTLQKVAVFLLAAVGVVTIVTMTVLFVLSASMSKLGR